MSAAKAAKTTKSTKAPKVEAPKVLYTEAIIISETEKALKVKVRAMKGSTDCNREVWIPKSIAKVLEQWNNTWIQVPTWFADKTNQEWAKWDTHLFFLAEDSVKNLY